MIHATCFADSARKCKKLVPKPAWTIPIMHMFGNPLDKMPCRVCGPSDQRSERRCPSRPTGSNPSRLASSVVTS